VLNAFELIARRVWPLLTVLLCAALVLLSFASVQAQSGGGVEQTGTGGRHTIQGRIYFPSGQRSDIRVQVKLESYNAGELSVLSDSNGSFRFSGLNPGSYTVLVDAGEQYEIVRESIYIDTDGANSRQGITFPISRLYTVQIALQLKRSEATRVGVVNAALAGIPSGARDLYRKALESARVGDSKKAVAELQSALAVYPNFPLALNELGVQYLKLKQANKAAESFGAAVKLSPEEFTPRLNYGIALVEEKNFLEAESQLREALKKNDSSPGGHLYLGITLISLQDYLQAEKELLRAVKLGGDNMSLAHYYLAGIYWQRKKHKAAADELELYLKLVPNASDVARIRATIKQLRSQK